MCVLSNTANLLRATHTAVNPDALLPSDTKTRRSSATSKTHYNLGVQPCYPVYVELYFICTCTSVLIQTYLQGCCYQFPLGQHAAHKHSSLDYLHSSENKRMHFTTMYQLVMQNISLLYEDTSKRQLHIQQKIKITKVQHHHLMQFNIPCRGEHSFLQDCKTCCTQVFGTNCA